VVSESDPKSYLAEVMDRMYEISKILYDEKGKGRKKAVVLIGECKSLLVCLEKALSGKF